MKCRGTAWACGLLGLLLGPAAARGQNEQPLLAHQAWIKFSLPQGRLAVSIHTPIQRAIKRENNGNNSKRFESLQVTPSNDGVSLAYERLLEGVRVIIRVDEGTTFTLRQEVPDDPSQPIVELLQKGREPLVMTVRRGANVETAEAPSIWRLALAHRKTFTDDLAPLLAFMMPVAWDEQLRQLETALLAPNQVAALPQRTEWLRWVDGLDSPKFFARESAERRLREVGPTLWPVLKARSRSGLTAEQRLRVARILESLEAGRVPETPQRAANWLAYDVEVWLVLLARDDAQTRVRALDQLKILLGKEVEFNPQGAEEERDRQLEALRETLAGSGG